MLSIYRTLMGDPELIMIDEPTEGLAPLMVERIRELLQEIARCGISILLVEQRLVIAIRISHRVCHGARPHGRGHAGRIVGQREHPPRVARGLAFGVHPGAQGRKVLPYISPSRPGLVTGISIRSSPKKIGPRKIATISPISRSLNPGLSNSSLRVRVPDGPCNSP